jgi:hypothetical protein
MHQMLGRDTLNNEPVKHILLQYVNLRLYLIYQSLHNIKSQSKMM